MAPIAYNNCPRTRETRRAWASQYAEDSPLLLKEFNAIIEQWKEWIRDGEWEKAMVRRCRHE